MSVYALVLAAGFSSRMAPHFKPLLPLPAPAGTPRTAGLTPPASDGVPAGEISALAAVCACHAAEGVRVLVVGGHRAADIAAAARACHAAFVENPHPEDGMFSSVRAGVAALPADCTHFFVHPVDIPLVRRMTVRSLLEAARAAAVSVTMPKASAENVVCTAQLPVLIPVFRGEEGHPPLFPAALREQLLGWRGEGGLRAACADWPHCHVPVADALMLRDMDTAADYATVREWAACADVLSPEEAEALLCVRGLPERGQAHCRAVAAVAAAFAATLNRARVLRDAGEPLLDVPLARAGGMVHDVCKGQPRHEAAAGALFRAWGMERMAWLVEAHRDMELPPESPLTERELVFLADKYVRGPRPVTLEARFQQKMEQFSGDAAACAAISGRLTRARRMAERFAQESGCDPAALARRVLPDASSVAAMV